MPFMAVALLMGVAPAPEARVVPDVPVATLTGEGVWSRVLCAACVAAFVAVATELTPMGVILVANSAPWAATGCALQCAIATM